MNAVVSKFTERGYLVSPDLINCLDGDVDGFLNFVGKNFPEASIVSKSLFELFNKSKNSFPKIVVNKIFKQDNEKKDLTHWTGYFNTRYAFLRKVLQNRPELKNITSISRINHLSGSEEFSIIGMVSDFRETKKGNIMIGLEDPTGSVSVLLSKSNPDYGLFNTIVHDEVIGLVLNKSGSWFFVKRIIFPDVPNINPKSCPEEVCAAFFSDTHIGSNTFLSNDFQKFIDWIKGEAGTAKSKALAAKTKYLFFVGDVVDGVGVYPNQESQLEIKSIYKQYEKAYDYLKQVPEDVTVIICPGNHDALRLSEPQPPLFSDFAEKIFKLPNILLVSNPCQVTIASSNSFQGFNVLLYHGYSFDYFINNNQYLRSKGYSRPDAVMEFLLRKRHLAPSHGSTLIAPSKNEDFLLIDKVPDIMATGHVHQSSVSQYKNIMLLNASCFQGQSEFMKRIGTKPNPGKVPVVDLKNRSTTVLNFYSGD